MRKKVALFVVVLISAIFLQVPAYALEAFEIKAYDVKMIVRDDNTYDITETIDVEFSQQRHGIYRTLPLQTYDGLWVSIKDIDVSSHKYSVSRSGAVCTIKIGDASKFASQKERYLISYNYAIGEDNVPHMDELYFDIIGTDWDTYISNVTFEIEMPFEFDKSKISFSYGQYGSVSKDAVSYTVDGKTIKGKLNQKLGIFSGLTIALPLPQGYYVNARERFNLGKFFVKYFVYLLLGLYTVAFLIWYKYGRDRKIFPTVEFYPPKDLTSADIGYIIDGKVDAHDITSLLIYWADKGYLSITETEKKTTFVKRKNFILTKLSDLPPSAKDYEREMFDKLFSTYGNEIAVSTDQLKNRFYNTVSKVRTMILNRYKFNSKNGIYTVSGEVAGLVVKLIAFLAAFVGTFLLYDSMENDPTSTKVVLGLIMAAVVSVPLGSLADLIYQWSSIIAGKKLLLTIKRIFINVVVLFGMIAMAATYGNFIIIVICFMSCFALMLFSMYCRKRTELGDSHMEKILGLKDFIINAERDRINTLVEENPKYFYNVLPFAMVLGVTDKWARDFEHIALEPPDWYASEGGFRTFNSIAMLSVINSSMNSLETSMTSSPASTGSGGGSMGGGFSGGGSGGGGGGSW